MKRTCLLGSVIIVLLSSSLASGKVEPEKGYETAMTLGSFQYETGDYAHAVESFTQALAIKPADGAALLSLGTVYSRSGDLENAKTALLKALELDKANRRVLYELGVVLYKQKAMEEANGYFTRITAGGVEDELTTSAKRYLAILAARKAGPFTLTVLAGLQHDSNVILEPSNPVVTGAKRSDWRAVASLNAAYAFVRQEKSTAEVGYSLYQSIHNELTDFNVQQHSLTVGGRRALAENALGGLAYRYSYAFVGGDRYSGIHQITPTVSFTLSPTQSADLSYIFEDRTFFDGGEFPQNSDRNGTNNAVALSYKVSLSSTLGASAGLAYDKDSTSKPWWSGAGQKISVGLSEEVAGVKAYLGWSFTNKDYSDVAPGYTDKRQDQTQELSVNLIRELSKRVSIDVSDVYTRNRSNLGLFDYTRNIVGLFAVVTL